VTGLSPSASTARAHRRPVGRTAIPWAAVVTFAALLATADWFWVVALRGAVGATERTSGPFVSWLQGSVLLTPLFAFAVLAALALAFRWFGPVLRRRRSVLATGLLIVAAGTLAGTGTLLVSGAYDYRLQLDMLDHMLPMGVQCVESCEELQKDATTVLQLKALGFGSLILLVTNLVLVAWLVALRGGRLTVGKPQPPDPGPRVGPSAWFDELQLFLAAGLIGSGTVLAVHATADLIDSVVAALLLVVLATLQLLMAHVVTTRPGKPAWVAAGAIAAALPLLWISAHSPRNPLESVLGSPGSVGLADGAIGVLEIATLIAAVVLLSRPAWLRRAPASPHAGKLGVVGIVAVTVIGVGGSGLAMFDLGGLDESPTPGNHHTALR
jgi:hypothetical protein